jgi:hypothetical protein
MFEGYNIDPSCYWATDRYRELGSPTPVGTTELPLPMTIFAPPAVTEAKTFPMFYLLKPVKAQELMSQVEGVTVSNVAKDFPEQLIKEGKAKELRSKFS